MYPQKSILLATRTNKRLVAQIQMLGLCAVPSHAVSGRRRARCTIVRMHQVCLSAIRGSEDEHVAESILADDWQLRSSICRYDRWCGTLVTNHQNRAAGILPN